MLAKIATSYQFLLSNLIFNFSRFPFPTLSQVLGNSVHSLSLLDVKCGTKPYVVDRTRRIGVVTIARSTVGRPIVVIVATTATAVVRRVGLHCPFVHITR